MPHRIIYNRRHYDSTIGSESMKRAPLASGQSHSMQEDDLPAIAGGTPVRPRDTRLVFGAPVIGEAEIASVVECLRSRWIGLGAASRAVRAGVRALQRSALRCRGQQRYGRHSSRAARAGHRPGR